jgi:hypothetical protein
VQYGYAVQYGILYALRIPFAEMLCQEVAIVLPLGCHIEIFNMIAIVYSTPKY